MIVYGWSGAAMVTLWSTSDIGAGSNAIAWQISNEAPPQTDEVYQLARVV